MKEEEEVTDSQLKRLEKFSGKRNAVVSLFVPANSVIGKVLDGIEGRVKGIKHSNKKGQIGRVLAHIRERTLDRKTFGGRGCVVCCGLDNTDQIFYDEVRPPHADIEVEEYFYDYVFHMDKLRELFYADVVVRVDEAATRAELQRLAMSSSPLLLLGPVEVIKCMNETPGCVNVVTMFDGGPKNSDFLSDSFVQRLRDTKAVLRRVPVVTDDTREFVKGFGFVFAQRRY